MKRFLLATHVLAWYNSWHDTPFRDIEVKPEKNAFDLEVNIRYSDG
jgi:hypothetical protein